MKSCFTVCCGLLFLALCACAPFKPGDKRAAICNELNSQLIFDGSTSNDRQSEIEGSERALAQRSYEANHCDRP